MKPDPDYICRLLDTLQCSPSPWPRISYVVDSGIRPDEQLVFHLQLLNDGEFLQPINGDDSFGFVDYCGDELGWQDISIRLTAKGHEFIEALSKQDVLDAIKDQFKNPSLKTMFDIGRTMIEGVAREKIKQWIGTPKV